MKGIKALPALLAIIFSIGFSLASETVNNPESDFVTNSLSYELRGKNANIIRMDADVFGDGNPVIFLRTVTGGGKCGQNWTVYIPVQGSGYARIGDVQFREDTFKAGRVENYNPTGGVLAYYPAKRGGDLMRITFVGGGATTEKIRFLDIEKEEDRALFKKLFAREMDEGVPRQYFENPPHKVIDVMEIKARVNAQQITTPPTPTTAQSTPVPTPPAPDQVDKQPPKPSASLTPMTETRSAPSDLPIVRLAIVAALIVGIVLYLLRRNSA